MNRKYVASFPINVDTKPEQLLELSKLWISNNPNSPFKFASFNNCGTKIQSCGYKVLFKELKMDEEELIGISYTSPGNRLNSFWTTNIVGSKTSNYFEVGVEVKYSGSGNIEFAKKPRIINDILEKLGGGRDGNILIPTTSLYTLEDINLNQISQIKNILLGRTGNKLPVIYISKDYYGQSILTFEEKKNLAKKLGGLAHIIIEPDRLFSIQLNKNGNICAQNGAIGIYWTDGNGRELILPKKYTNLSNGEIDSNKIVSEIETKIISSSLNKNLSHVSWERLGKLEGELLIQELKQQTETSDLLNLYEISLKETENELNLVLEENKRLETLLIEANAKTNLQSSVINEVTDKLFQGISETYEGEFGHILKQYLTIGVSQINERYIRQTEVAKKVKQNINSLFNENSSRDFEIKKLKKILQYRNFGKKEKKELEKLGFEVTIRKNNHLKISKGGISTTLPSTRSKMSGVKNSVSDFIKAFY